MYRSLGRLVRYLAAQYHIPLDRAHILGHDNVPGTTPAHSPGMHWDPGPYWDWAHYFDLLGTRRSSARRHRRPALVTIRPDYAHEPPAFTGCDGRPPTPCPPHGSASVQAAHRAARGRPLVKDIGLHPDGAPPR